MRSSNLTATTVALATALTLACPARQPGDERAASADSDPRIVVMAPMAAEIIAALGEEDRIVGAGDWVTWPPAVAARPKVGSYEAPNLEVILALGTDVFVSTASQAATAAHQHLRELGIDVIELDGDTVAGVYSAIALLGKRLGRADRASRLIEEIRGRLEAVSRRARDLERPRVLVVVGSQPIFVAAAGSAVDEMLQLAGGQNVFPEPGPAYRQVSLEAILERQPEIIVDTSNNRPGAPRGNLAASWGDWPFLPAVERERVFWLPPVRLVISGPRMPEVAELLGRLVHPEVFGKPTIEDYSVPRLEARD